MVFPSLSVRFFGPVSKWHRKKSENFFTMSRLWSCFPPKWPLRKSFQRGEWRQSGFISPGRDFLFQPYFKRGKKTQTIAIIIFSDWNHFNWVWFGNDFKSIHKMISGVASGAARWRPLVLGTWRVHFLFPWPPYFKAGPYLLWPRNPRESEPSAKMSEQMTLRGTLQGHAGWVTQIATTPQRPDMILSASRGKVPACLTCCRRKHHVYNASYCHWGNCFYPCIYPVVYSVGLPIAYILSVVYIFFSRHVFCKRSCCYDWKYLLWL